MNKRHLGYLVACLLPVACGAEGEVQGYDLSEGQAQGEDTLPEANADMGPGEDSVVAEQTVLHRVETAGETIEISKFVTIDGEEALMMREEGSAYQQPLLDLLADSFGPLTTLETLYALDPHVPIPARELVDAQAFEAAALGRASTEVVRVEFDVDAAVEKAYSTAACDAAAYPTTANHFWTLKGSRNGVSGPSATCLKNDCGQMTTNYTVSRICNDADTTVQERNAWDFDLAAPWNTTNWTNVPVNTSVGWYMVAGPSRRYSADGNSAVGKKYHSRSGARVYSSPVR